MLNDLSIAAVPARNPPLRPAARNGRARSRAPRSCERILTIAARTPDHGKLVPWRFVIVGDDQRDALAALLHRALHEHDPERDGRASRKGGRVRPSGAASWSSLVSAPVPGHKIPVWEQELSCGAAGMNLLSPPMRWAIVGGWLTGWRGLFDARPRRLLRAGRADRRLHLHRQPGRELEERPRAPLATRRAAVGPAGRFDA